jgi:hypothetical protein
MCLLNFIFNLCVLMIIITIITIAIDDTIDKAVKKEQIITLLVLICFGYVVYRLVDLCIFLIEYNIYSN